MDYICIIIWDQPPPIVIIHKPATTNHRTKRPKLVQYNSTERPAKSRYVGILVFIGSHKTEYNNDDISTNKKVYKYEKKARYNKVEGASGLEETRTPRFNRKQPDQLVDVKMKIFYLHLLNDWTWTIILRYKYNYFYFIVRNEFIFIMYSKKKFNHLDYNSLVFTS